MVNNKPSFLINAQESVLAVKLTRSWDFPLTQRFCLRSNQEIALCLPRHWALIADISHWCLTTEECCDYFFEFHKACIDQGLTHQVIVLPRSALKRWRIKAFLSSDLSIKTYLAESQFDGVNWLRSKGFTFPGYAGQLTAI